MYTVFRSNDVSQIISHKMSAEDAMHAILTHDGYDYRVEFHGGSYELLVSNGSRASTTGLDSFNVMTAAMAETRAEAMNDLAAYVIGQSGGDWSALEAKETDRFFSDEIAYNISEASAPDADDDERIAHLATAKELQDEWKKLG